MRCARLRQMGTLTEGELVADHYLSLVSSAKMLREIVKIASHPGDNSASLGVIRHLVADIKEKHRKDFGLRLEWEEPQHENQEGN